MKTRYHNLGMFALLFALLLAGCGGGSGGAPGSSGTGDTGILIKSVSIIGSSGSTSTTVKINDLDVHNHLCSDGKPEPDTVVRDSATITISATKINPNLVSDPFPASVEQCTITYLKANEDPSAPVIPSLTIYPNCTIIDAEDNKCDVTLMDIQRKFDYWTNINNGLNLPSEYPTHYVAQYDCQYTGNFGKTGIFRVEYDIWLADFNLCAQ